MNLNDINILLKKALKLGLSWCLYYSGLLSLYLNSKIYWGNKNEVLILRYHRVYDDHDKDKFLGVGKSNFDRQMQYIKKKYHPLPLEEMVEALKTGREVLPGSVAVTFDDGYKDNITNAYPVLNKYKVPATIYLTAGYIGTSNILPWDRLRYIITCSKLPSVKIPSLIPDTLDLSSPGKRKECFYRLLASVNDVDDAVKNQAINDLEDQLIDDLPLQSKNDILLSWEDVARMEENGISFGGHTLTHPLLTRVGIVDAEFQIKKSKSDIEQKLGKKITTFAYPGGAFNQDIKKAVKENGYEAACSTISGVNDKSSDLFALKRKGISGGSSTGLTGRFSKTLFAVEMSGLFDKLFFRL